MGVAVTPMAQIEQRTTHIKILGCGLGGRVVDGDSRADQVDESRRAIKSWFYNIAAVRDWTPGRPWNTRRPGLQSLPSGQGGVPKEDKPNQ